MSLGGWDSDFTLGGTNEMIGGATIHLPEPKLKKGASAFSEVTPDLASIAAAFQRWVAEWSAAVVAYRPERLLEMP